MPTYTFNDLSTGVPITNHTTEITVTGGKTVATYSACGGPANTIVGGDGFEAGPTDSGEFVIAGCWKHSSSRYPMWSNIPWGSALRETSIGIEVRIQSAWEPLSRYSEATKSDIEAYHYDLYGTAIVPSQWKFNDFGHITCYIFKDKNRNKTFDRSSEKIHGEMFHTTPVNEAQTELGRTVELEESHGCIHVKPRDMDQMIEKGYLKKGNLVYIHPYSRTIPNRAIDTTGKQPFIVHFFPKDKKIMIVGH
jgi:hypothetical protein